MAAPRKTTAPGEVQIEGETADQVIAEQFETLPQPSVDSYTNLKQPETVSPMVTPAPGEPIRTPTVQALGFNAPEVVVGAVQKTAGPTGVRKVKLRVNEDISDMTMTGGGRTDTYNLTAGHWYEVPVEVARELARINKIWH